MEEFLQGILTTVGDGLLNFLAALGFLILFWLLALIASAVVRWLFGRTQIDERISKAIGGEGETQIRLDRWISAIVFWIVMLFGIVAFFNRLDLQNVSAPLQIILDQAAAFVPSLLGALALLVVAWFIASIFRFVITQLGTRLKIDERLTKQADLDAQDVSITRSLGTAAYWLVFLFFLPAVLSQLQLQGLVEPVQNMVGAILEAVPSAFSAALILVVGWFIARIVRQIVENLLKAAGLDAIGERVGLVGQQALSTIAGTVVYALIMITTLIAALGELQIEALSGPATAMLENVLAGVPAVFGAVLILGLAYLVARLVANLLTSILTGVGFNRVPEMLGFEVEQAEGQRTLSEIAGYLLIIAVMLFAATEAANVLGLGLIATSILGLTQFFGDVLLALVIFGLGLYLANLTKSIVLGAGGSNSSFMANVARLVILVFAAAMALRQTGIADEIVNLAFGILLGALGVAAALAFGLGAKDVAGREVESWLASMRSSGEDVSEDK